MDDVAVDAEPALTSHVEVKADAAVVSVGVALEIGQGGHDEPTIAIPMRLTAEKSGPMPCSQPTCSILPSLDFHLATER